VQVSAREEAGDTIRLRMKLGAAPTNGRYLPWEHVLHDDLVTVHSGTGQWDWNEQSFPVAALTVALRPGGDWDCWVDLGASYAPMEQRRFQVTPTPAHTHRPLPCCVCLADSTVPGTDANVVAFWTWDETNAAGRKVQQVAAYPSIGQAAFEMDNGYNLNTRPWYGGHPSGVLVPHEGATPRWLPATAGEPITVSADFGPRTADGTFAVDAYWYDSSHVKIGEDRLWTRTVVRNDWIAVSATATPPTGATMFRLYLTNNLASGGGFYGSRLDNVRITTGSSTPTQNPHAGTNVGCYALCDHTHPATEHNHDHQYADDGHEHAILEDIKTFVTDTSLVLSPDGEGGLEFREETGGAGGAAKIGTITIANPATSAIASWPAPLAEAPAAGAISISPTNAGAAASAWWVSDVDEDGFKLNLAATPSVSASFGWHAHVGEAAPPPSLGVRSSATANSGGATSGSVTVSKPAGVVAGDVMLFTFGTHDDPGTITAPTGWTLVNFTPHAVSAGTRAYVYRRTVDGTEGSSFTFTLATNRTWAAGIVAIKGATAVPAAAGGQSQTSTVSITAPSVTPGAGDHLLIGVFTIRDASRTITAPTGMTQVWQGTSGATGTANIVVQVCVEETSTSPTGTRVASASGGTNFSSNVGQLVAMAEA
jgi:hypothetical protein